MNSTHATLENKFKNKMKYRHRERGEERERKRERERILIIKVLTANNYFNFLCKTA